MGYFWGKSPRDNSRRGVDLSIGNLTKNGIKFLLLFTIDKKKKAIKPSYISAPTVKL